jgi:hypothetical protein
MGHARSGPICGFGFAKHRGAFRASTYRLQLLQDDLAHRRREPLCVHTEAESHDLPKCAGEGAARCIEGLGGGRRRGAEIWILTSGAPAPSPATYWPASLPSHTPRPRHPRAAREERGSPLKPQTAAVGRAARRPTRAGSGAPSPSPLPIPTNLLAPHPLHLPAHRPWNPRARREAPLGLTTEHMLDRTGQDKCTKTAEELAMAGHSKVQEASTHANDINITIS